MLLHLTKGTSCSMARNPPASPPALGVTYLNTPLPDVPWEKDDEMGHQNQFPRRANFSTTFTVYAEMQLTNQAILAQFPALNIASLHQPLLPERNLSLPRLGGRYVAPTSPGVAYWIAAGYVASTVESDQNWQSHHPDLRVINGTCGPVTTFNGTASSKAGRSAAASIDRAPSILAWLP